MHAVRSCERLIKKTYRSNINQTIVDRTGHSQVSHAPTRQCSRHRVVAGGPASLASRVPDGDAHFRLAWLSRLCGAFVVGVLLEQRARLGRVALLSRVLLQHLGEGDG